jgi:branched-chain amino acid aminotransferase
MTLREIAKDLGLTVEERDIPVEELATFEEAGACGTAAVISPIGALYDLDNNVTYDYGMKVGETCKKMYDHLQGIQYGRVEDTHNWNVIVE